MRDLSLFELNTVSGGLSCIDQNMWKNIEGKASSDAIIFTVLTAPILMAGAYALSASYLVTAITGVTVAPYIAGIGYFNSSAWNIFS